MSALVWKVVLLVQARTASSCERNNAETGSKGAFTGFTREHKLVKTVNTLFEPVSALFRSQDAVRACTRRTTFHTSADIDEEEWRLRIISAHA